MRLETERLVLRKFVPADLADLHEIFGDPKVMEHCEPAYDLAKTEKFLNEFCIATGKAVACQLKETGKVIGYILWGAPDYPEIVEAGWIFNKDYWRQAYGFEAMTEMFRYGFEEQKLHKITAEATDFIKSVGIMKKLGMREEGVWRQGCKSHGDWRDLYWCGLLAEDYFADQAAAAAS